MDDDAVHELAGAPGVSPVLAHDLLAALRAESGASWFYVFWFAGGGSRPSASAGHIRRLLAFPTPDAALAFAQRNQLAGGGGPRLRRLSLARLLLAVLREPAIGALVLAYEAPEPPPPGQLPVGVVLERAALLERLGVRLP